MKIETEYLSSECCHKKYNLLFSSCTMIQIIINMVINFKTVCCTVQVNNETRKSLKDCTLHIVLKTQFEAISRYEHIKEKKLSEQIIESVILGNVKSRSKIVNYLNLTDYKKKKN